MGWFSPIKGHYPSLGQIDKTLPIDTYSADNMAWRGMIMDVTKDNKFELAASVTDENRGMLYIALQDVNDDQAGMAGTVQYDTDVTADTGVPSGMVAGAGMPSITGLSMNMEGEYETSMFDSTITATTDIGAPLTVLNGVLSLASDASTAVAYLTQAPTSRWVNNAQAKGVFNKTWRQGASLSVIHFVTK